MGVDEDVHLDEREDEHGKDDIVGGDNNSKH